MHKNFKNVGKIVYGRGAFNQLGEIILPKRSKNGYFLFVVDIYFKGKELEKIIPKDNNDSVVFMDFNIKEPTTEMVDTLRDEQKLLKGIPDGVVGIGGGSIMDIVKAVSLMFTNDGSSSLYQGLNLVKNPGIYHLGVPTISGTGAECSMTAVLTGPTKKLGLKCEWTVFDQIILDPDLVKTVPRDHWFYTGMDTYIHNIEAKSGIFYNTFSMAYTTESLRLCNEIFLNKNHGQNPENDEKLMLASLFGGLALTYSEVGACHALSYGLSYVFGTRHGYANCLAFRHLKEFYGDYVLEFEEMLIKNKINLPVNLSKTWKEEQINKMAEVSYNLGHMWTHALGHDWKNKLTLNDIKKMYLKL